MAVLRLDGEVKGLSQGEIASRTARSRRAPRDRVVHRELHALLGADVAGLGILGDQGRLQPHADQARGRARA